MLRTPLAAILSLGLLALPLRAFEIQINYDFDTNNFFDPSTEDGAAARVALEAAAARYSEIITTSLSPVVAGNPIPDTDPDWRLGFSHPGTGASFQISAAPSAAEDDIVNFLGRPPADLYDPDFSIPEDTWILFAGGRPLTGAGFGGTGTGTNFSPSLPNFPGVFLVAGSHLNRNWKGSDATYSVDSLPVWGGYVTFDNDGSTDWHFDINTLQTGGQTDFYSVAVHEIAHALGLTSNWSEFTDLVSDGMFKGPQAAAALDADNTTTGTVGVRIEGGLDYHFKDNTHQSFPFTNGSSPAPGVDGSVLQDLMMEPTANFTSNHLRFDVTNAEVAALRDIGWQTVPVELPATLSEWRVVYGPDDANPSGDGLNNLLKYALGLDPMTAATSDEIFYSTWEPGPSSSRFLSLNIPRKLIRPGITYTVESSDDQLQWDSGSGHTVVLEESPTMWRVRDAVTANGVAPRRFLRFRVEVSP